MEAGRLWQGQVHSPGSRPRVGSKDPGSPAYVMCWEPGPDEGQSSSGPAWPEQHREPWLDQLCTSISAGCVDKASPREKPFTWAAAEETQDLRACPGR